MATTFTAPPSWSNVGVAPSETLKTNGFQAGYKPPAPVFNYMFNKYGICIDELQKGKADTSHTHGMDNITGLEAALNRKADTSHTHGMNNIAGLEAALNRKADTYHTHADYENKTGKSLYMQIVYPEIGKGAQAGSGAEIFNDYKERTFATDGTVNQGNVASGEFSHAEGTKTTAVGFVSHAEGYRTKTVGYASHAEGQKTTASNVAAHAEGSDTTASGKAAHAEGSDTTASGNNSHAGGYSTKANAYQFVTGKYNTDKTGCTNDNDQSVDNSIFIIGYGTATTKANAFRVTAAGKCMGAQSFGSSGADYAEFFEWRDGNKKAEDRRGLFVALDGDKIRLATAADDYIVGVISANPSVVGDVQSENWHGMYKKDVFGQPLTETVEVPESTDEETGEVVPAHTFTRYVVNPDYDPDEEYTSREFRKEWACVGLMGKLVVVDDGTCEVNGYCKAADGGKATKSDTGYRVMKRIDSTHIQILYR